MTPFLDIYDLAMVSIKDYKIDKLFNPNDLTDFKALMKGYLVKGVTKFTNCKYDIDVITDLNNEQFTTDLTLTEQVILSNLTVIEWMESKILDITQFKLALNETDYKRYSEAQNLTAKMNTQNMLREIVNQDMTNYGIKNIPWSSWAAGDYGL